MSLDERRWLEGTLPTAGVPKVVFLFAIKTERGGKE
jgi:hypothetical protein